ncbi:uncharacterized protein A4U43_C07F13260 [Asparagus officinalis]|uniref:DBC1/CARP1 catalytically inactive NUDIX hydrolase domain-containing protein n=1 Tax=Asparagus officinalis TaxID=4686 RepID=A0A5P1EBX0_ASPOF|nr:uncharacterized protein A4U43_C07F13260 [Asparagus officinalis]
MGRGSRNDPARRYADSVSTSQQHQPEMHDHMDQVYPFCLVDVERDYLSLNKRYPRLCVRHECTKVVVHQPKQSFHLSLHTTVSDFDEWDEHTDASNELCSYKSSDERIIHFNNIFRFAILKKDRSFMAINSPWNAAIGGGDPSVEDYSLIHTAPRCSLLFYYNAEV